MTRRWTGSFGCGGAATATWAATTLAGAGLTADGLYLATVDSGAREALRFWAAARETGLRFAAPGEFPWTLSTSVTGAISTALGITGPCLTLVGPGAREEARELAVEDLAAGVVAAALLVELYGTPAVTVADAGTWEPAGTWELAATVLVARPETIEESVPFRACSASPTAPAPACSTSTASSPTPRACTPPPGSGCSTSS